jgi:hypothetical protein
VLFPHQFSLISTELGFIIEFLESAFGHMDHSPGELEGEIDFEQRDMAVEYLLMPERVKKLEGQLAALSCDLERISSNLEKLTVVLEKLCDVDVVTNAPKGAGGSQYVA